MPAAKTRKIDARAASCRVGYLPKIVGSFAALVREDLGHTKHCG
jgi:hypothetical protein